MFADASALPAPAVHDPAPVDLPEAATAARSDAMNRYATASGRRRGATTGRHTMRFIRSIIDAFRFDGVGGPPAAFA